MQLLFPSFLWLSLLAVIPIALYLFRRRSKRLDVSTLVFFKSLAREHQESAWLRRLKKLLSLLLTLAVLLGAVFALARVIVSPANREDVRTAVILLDRSASMAAADVEGRSRMEVAKELIRSRLDSLSEDTRIALLVYDARPEVVQPRTLNRRELLSRLAEVEVRPVAGQPAAGIEGAKVLARMETPALIWHVTDSVFEETAKPEVGQADGEAGEEVPVEVADSAMPEGVRLAVLPAGLEAPVNAGITAFRVRPVPLEHSLFEAFVQVTLNRDAPEPITATLEVNLGGMPSQVRELELNPGDSQGLVMKLEGAEEQLLRLFLRAPGDCLASDNEVMIPLPRSRPIVAAWIRPEETADPFTELALAAIQEEGELDLWKGTPESWPLPDEVDVVVFDHWLPDPWPLEIPAIVIAPPGNAGPIRARPLEGGGVPHDGIRVGNDQHPVLFRVSSSRVALAQTTVFDISGGSLEPLWIAGNEPVLAAGEIRGQRLVLMGFAAAQSEQLPLMASFPLLMGNALLWCAESSPSAEGLVMEESSGKVVPVKGTEVKWSQFRGGSLRVVTEPLEGPLLELDRVGLWETDEGMRGVSHLLSRKETDIRSRPQAEGATAEPESRRSWVAGDISWLLLAAIVSVLLLESWLFHRHAVY